MRVVTSSIWSIRSAPSNYGLYQLRPKMSICAAGSTWTWGLAARGIILAQAFPSGSARQEIRRRVVLRTEKGEIESGAAGVVIEEIAQELITRARAGHSQTPVKT